MMKTKRRARGPIGAVEQNSEQVKAPKFSGDEHAWGWSIEVERFFKTQGLPKSKWLSAVDRLLVGRAGRWFWWWRRENRHGTWVTFLRAVYKQFEPEVAEMLLQGEEDAEEDEVHHEPLKPWSWVVHHPEPEECEREEVQKKVTDILDLLDRAFNEIKAFKVEEEEEQVTTEEQLEKQEAIEQEEETELEHATLELRANSKPEPVPEGIESTKNPEEILATVEQEEKEFSVQKSQSQEESVLETSQTNPGEGDKITIDKVLEKERRGPEEKVEFTPAVGILPLPPPEPPDRKRFGRAEVTTGNIQGNGRPLHPLSPAVVLASLPPTEMSDGKIRRYPIHGDGEQLQTGNKNAGRQAHRLEEETGYTADSTQVFQWCMAQTDSMLRINWAYEQVAQSALKGLENLSRGTIVNLLVHVVYESQILVT